MGKIQELLSRLPSVEIVLSTPLFRRLTADHGRALVTSLLREDLDRLRKAIRAGEIEPRELRARLARKAMAERIAAAAERVLAPSPRPVINATGVVVHTNLGRSLLSGKAARRVAQAAEGYMDLEYDLRSGRRGSRMDHLEPLMGRLFPGRSFVVVNNNAAAILLALRTLARRKEVIVSRGELVEIGGSFRVPDILAASGARLREVGTTNRTRLSDYRKAIGPRSGLLLKVHTSNFRIVGFAEETGISDLSALGREAGIPLVVDWGSGDLVDLEPLGIPDEIPARAVLEAGADLVTFSGDKLLGGPQAGFVVGDPELVGKLRKDPLARVCRLDRLMIAALHETLSSYVRGREFEEVPTLAMLGQGRDEIAKRARRVKRRLASLTGQGKRLSLVEGVSRTGGGSSPTGERPTMLLAVAVPGGDAGALERSLRRGDPPILGRVQEGRLLLDLRTVLDEQEETLVLRLGEELHRGAKNG